jgi:hypothetical protein
MGVASPSAMTRYWRTMFDSNFAPGSQPALALILNVSV